MSRPKQQHLRRRKIKKAHFPQHDRQLKQNPLMKKLHIYGNKKNQIPTNSYLMEHLEPNPLIKQKVSFVVSIRDHLYIT